MPHSTLVLGAVLALGACSTAESETATVPAMPSGVVAIGERMKGSITTEVVAPDLLVSGAAVVTERGSSFVFVKRDAATFAVRPVTMGRNVGDRVAIVSGLSANEVIAVRGVLLLEAASQQSR